MHLLAADLAAAVAVDSTARAAYTVAVPSGAGAFTVAAKG